MSYEAIFFIVPSRILKLDGLILSHLRVYETIFQFWNHDKPCFLSNDSLMERTGIKSASTIREALMFFEKHGELLRVTEKGKRYIVQPVQKIPVDNFDEPVARSTPPRRQVDAPPVARSTHKNKNLKERKEERETLPHFEPDNENIALCDRECIDLKTEIESFMNRHSGQKTQYEFRRWLQNAIDYKHKRGMALLKNPVIKESRCTVPWFNDNH